MNRSRFLLAIAAVVLLAPPALSGTITSDAIAGPGGFAFSTYFSNTDEIAMNFTSIDYVDISITVDSAGSYDIYEAPTLGHMSNGTGEDWSGVKFINMTPELGSFGAGWTATGVFTSVSVTSNLVTFGGGTLLDGSSNAAPDGFYDTTGPGTFTVRQIPIRVPEPSTLVLGALAGVASVLVGVRRRRNGS